ncbi:MAG: hypothetical protein KAF91_21935 [Nostoc sp. TH1S01]|nr:hypothetical protein [Nostoc sp. TH1S01]
MLKNSVDGLSQVWVKVGKYLRVTSKSVMGASSAKIRYELITFNQLVKSMASGETLKLLLIGLKIVVIDVSLARVLSSLPRNMKQAHFYGVSQTYTV